MGLADSFPEWVAGFHEGVPLGGLLDLGNPEAREYIREFLAEEVEVRKAASLFFQFSYYNEFKTDLEPH